MVTLNSINIKLDFETSKDAFSNVLSELKVAQLRTPNMKSRNILTQLSEIVPYLTLRSDVGSIDIFDRRIRADIGESETITVPEEERKGITDELLASFELDLNFVSSVFLGRLNIKHSDVKISGHAKIIRSEATSLVLNHLFKASAVGLATWARSADFIGYTLKVEENIAGLSSTSDYTFFRPEKSTEVHIGFDAKLTGPIPLAQLVKSFKERVQTLINTSGVQKA